MRLLEKAGRDGRLEIITSETSSFLHSLRAFVNDITPQKNEDACKKVDEDKPFLRDKLLVIKAACEEFDESAAEEVLAELRSASWTQQTEELLRTISEQLLHSDFDEIVAAVSVFLENDGMVPCE